MPGTFPSPFFRKGTGNEVDNLPLCSSKDCLARINAMMSSSARLSPVKLILPLDELYRKEMKFKHFESKKNFARDLLNYYEAFHQVSSKY